MEHNSHAPTGNIDITLAQINEMLNAVGFPIINPARVQTLQELAPRERIIRAIKVARNDPGARAWLTRLFNQAGIALQGGPAVPQDKVMDDNQDSDFHPSEDKEQPSDMHDDGNYAQHNDQLQSNEHDSSYRGRHQQDDAAAQSGTGSQQIRPEDRASFHVYGGKAALCFEADETKQGVPTIALDAASSTGPRAYDWNGKIRLQLTRAELPVVAAVLLGVMTKCEFKNHGQDNSKGFSIERQEGGKVFIKVMAKDQGVKAVPVGPADVFYIASLVMRQLRKANPWLDGTALISLVRSTQSGC